MMISPLVAADLRIPAAGKGTKKKLEAYSANGRSNWQVDWILPETQCFDLTVIIFSR
jgi:hypothetical protein